MFDLVIKDGKIVDGTGESIIFGDIGIVNGMICAVGSLADYSTLETIDADGALVCPGFIDVHSHSELDILRDPRCLPKVSQGVTTEILGNCGISAFPVSQKTVEQVKAYTTPVLGKMDNWTWTDFRTYFDCVMAKGVTTNLASLVGHGNLRIEVMGFENRHPSEHELNKMKALLSQAMEQGALGYSTGLIYAPGCYSDTMELVELAKVGAQHCGIYATHMRSESSGLLAAVEESIRIARESGIQLQISHLKAVGRPNFGKVKDALRLIEDAVADGLSIYVDRYPYIAGSTTLNIVLPPWTLEGGIDSLMDILSTPEKRELVRTDLTNGLPNWDNRVETIGWNNIIVASVQTQRNKWAEGLNLVEVADRRGEDKIEALLNLLLEENASITALLMANAEEDVATVLSHPLAMVGSDGIPSGGKPHPRLYGSFTKYITQYMQDGRSGELVEAIRKITSLPAEVFKLREIGTIKPGFRADILIIEPDRLKDKATFHDPIQFSDGIREVIIGGQVVYREKEHTGKLPGVVFKKAQES